MTRPSRTPNGEIVLLAYNNAHTARAFAVEWQGEYLSYRLPAGAAVTLLWN